MKLLRKTVIKDRARISTYLIRWSLPYVFGWSMKLHKIVRADSDSCNHDHPWEFLRVILWGGYDELQGPDSRPQTCLPWRPWAPWRVYYCPADFQHRIIRLRRQVNWTLVFTRRPSAERTWGFFTTQGWMHYETFLHEKNDGHRVAWCTDVRELTPNQEAKYESDDSQNPATAH